MVELKRRRLGLTLIGVIAVAAAAILWSLSARLPVDEARRFFYEPIRLGDEPPPSTTALVPPDEVERRYTAARVAFREGRHTEAAEAFASVVEGNPAGPLAGSAQWNLVRSRMRSGNGNAALDGLETLLRHYAGYLEEQAPPLLEALEHLERGDTAAGEASFDRMLEEYAESELVPLAYALKGRIYWNQRKPTQAVRAFVHMLDSVEDDVTTYRELSGLLERYVEGDTGVAEEFAARANQADEGFRDIYRYVAARSFLEQNRFAETHQALEELRSSHPRGDFSHVIDLEHAWNLFRNGEPAAALEIFERLEQAPPEGAEAFDRFFDVRAEYPMGIARCQLALGRDQQAIETFQRALDLYPRSIWALENRMGMALGYEKLGQPGRAAEILRTAIAEHPEDPELWAVRQQLARVKESAQ